MLIGVFFTPLAGATEPGAYIGVSVGPTAVNSQYLAQQNADHLVANGYTLANLNMGKSVAGYKFTVGYQFNRFLATELMYSYLGSYHMTGTTSGPTYNVSGYTRIRAEGIDVVGIIPFSSTLSGLVRAGYFQGKDETTVSFSGAGDQSWTNDYSDKKLGVGMEWEVAPDVHVRIEEEYYSRDQNRRVRLISIGIR